MKQFPDGTAAMRMMYSYIADAYQALPKKEHGSIQFCLSDGDERIDCRFEADGESMKYIEGVHDGWDVRLEASLADWLALAEGRLRPALGVLLRRLKFEGDVSTFSRVIPKDLYDVDIEELLDPVTEFERRPRENWVRPRKVLLVNGAPRGVNGYTQLYSDYVADSLSACGVDVDQLVLARHKVGHCLGCLQCWLRLEGQCIVKDDVPDLYERYEECDLIIYAFPLYAYGVPGLLKDFIDRGVTRQYPYFEKGLTEIRHPRRDRGDKAFMAFSICGFPTQTQFDSVRAFFRLYSHSSHAPLVAEIYRPGAIFLVQNPFNYVKLKTFLSGLKEGVREVVESGGISQRTMKKLNVGVSEEAFLPSTNKYWDNLYTSGDLRY